jgi:hypothetical protein
MEKQTKVEIEETSSFEERLGKAHKTLSETGVNLIEIPEGNGMMLVRQGTPEAADRLSRQGAVLYEKKIEEETFLVCLN